MSTHVYKAPTVFLWPGHTELFSSILFLLQDICTHESLFFPLH